MISPTSFISWRSIFAGALISQIFFVTLVALGVAISGMSLDYGDSLRGYGWGAAIWFTVSAAVSLFAGCFLAGRISNYKNRLVGAVEGLTIGALFFAVFLYQVGFATGVVASKGADALGGIIANTDLQQIVSEVLDENRRETSLVSIASGVLTRLANGDADGAVDYLAAQTGLERDEAQKLIDRAQPVAREQLSKVTEAAAGTMAGLGWMLFILLGLGMAASGAGGAFGSRRNFEAPLAEGVVQLPTERVAR